jgi:hypothetical protein
MLEEADLEKFFKYCELYPNKRELISARDSIVKCMSYTILNNDFVAFFFPQLDHKMKNTQGFDKNTALETIYFIYPPEGTNMNSTRISTWLNPTVLNEDAMKLKGFFFNIKKENSL